MPVKKKPKPKSNPPLDEFERVTKWRFDALIDLGLAPDQAIGLIETPDVVHVAKKFVDVGCPSALVVLLLEGS